jgi:hypothetical protein
MEEEKMGNALKMDKKAILTGLFKLGWSDRAINKHTGIHRVTVKRYRAELQNVPKVPADKQREAEEEAQRAIYANRNKINRTQRESEPTDLERKAINTCAVFCASKGELTKSECYEQCSHQSKEMGGFTKGVDYGGYR